MSYRRRTTRRTRYVQPKQKYTGFYDNQVAFVSTATDALAFTNFSLVRNLSNFGAFAPPIQKIKHLKCTIDIPRLALDFRIFYIDVYVMYLPQGSLNLSRPSAAPDVNNAGAHYFADSTPFIKNHPEWILARSTGIASSTDISRIHLSTKLTRNLNTGDEIAIFFQVRTDVALPQIEGWAPVTGFFANVCYSYYSRSN